MSSVIGIGSLGGSGTRAVAQVLMDAGIYMGDDLNHANDNLIFTRLFKNPGWYRNANKRSVEARLRVFEEYMQNDRISLKNAATLIGASANNPTMKSHRELAWNMLGKIGKSGGNRDRWGWKEPNTQIFIEDLSNYFPSFKYIHVVRHGLDMAFSKNRQQLNNWGPRYDIHLNGNESKEEIAFKQLEYWIRSNKDVASKGERLGSDFLLLNHTTFCSHPRQQVDRIISFLGIELPMDRLAKLYELPRDTGSNDRYSKFDIGIFDDRQIDYVRQLGFEV
ncbi:MAG: sulfotransferase [Burkholderiaceae bacterium]